MSTPDAFDPRRPPLIEYRVVDSERPDAVGSWRWWGPTPEWDVVGWIARVDDGLVLERLSIVPHGSYEGEIGEYDEDDPFQAPAAGLPSGALRAIPLGRLMAQVYGDLLDRAKTAPADQQWARHVLAIARGVRPEVAAPPRRGGRPRLSDELLRDVATAYLDELAMGGRGVWRRLADRFGVTESKVRDWIRAARRRQYLADAENPGKREARPGPRLLAEAWEGVTGLEGTGFEYASKEERDAAWEALRAAQAKQHLPDQPPL